MEVVGGSAMGSGSAGACAVSPDQGSGSAGGCAVSPDQGLPVLAHRHSGGLLEVGGDI